MTTNITTLALNLLISERVDQRNIFADKIATLLDEVNANENDLKKEFISAIGQCKINPNSEARDSFYQLAQYFTEKLNAAA